MKSQTHNTPKFIRRFQRRTKWNLLVEFSVLLWRFDHPQSWSDPLREIERKKKKNNNREKEKMASRDLELLIPVSSISENGPKSSAPSYPSVTSTQNHSSHEVSFIFIFLYSFLPHLMLINKYSWPIFLFLFS